jgi:predicted nucleotidyltransferase
MLWKPGKAMQNDVTNIQQELSALTKIIIDTVPVASIYLFGSYAYGIPNKDSDIDLYIVFKDDMRIRELDALLAVRMAIHSAQNKSIDMLGIKQNRFLERGLYATLERKIVREGVKLYG